ncbi:histidine--tRNA ligase [Opitutales bacterium ASA1]|uniref:histidine--tRNA ligase n=1 Tax=Congregicoccus parvus TaxID=3081749 RepID=UPI002B30ABBD|nr:histidine--tRNA ligase [Opitutales bacterium ASA1]
MALPQTLPGFREFYPEAMAARQHLFRVWRQTALAYGFQEYDGPVLEPLELYTRKSGDEIEAQLFSFTDKGGREVALRPEMTPTVCRLVGAKANALKRPIKWFSVAEFYRYERMQKGRGRCFFQFNADVFGEAGPEAEVELIALMVQCMRGFGLTAEDFYVRLSDRDLWIHYLRASGFSDAEVPDVLSTVDKFEKLGDAAFKGFEEKHGALAAGRREAITGLLSVRGFEALETRISTLGDPALQARLGDWRTLLDGLQAMGLEAFVEVDLGVVRGLSYYTGFVFEAFDRKGDLRALAGGGRYNDLVARYGGPQLPAVGFAIGDMTFQLLLEARGLAPAIVQSPDVYVVAGEAERSIALGFVNEMRAAGIRTEYALKAPAFGKQFKLAGQSGARLALVFGAEEVARGTAKIRDMRSGTESEETLDNLPEAIREALRS